MSTHLFHGERLERAHLDQIRRHGFDLVELFATRTHIDYHDPHRLADLRRELDRAGLEPWSLHAPISESFTGGTWGRAYSNASPQAAARQEAVDETQAAVRAAGDLGCAIVVLHLGVPRGQSIPPGDNDPAAARRSLEPIAEACARARVQLALEVIPNALSTAEALLEWLDGDLELGPAGACLDIGHAHVMSGAPETAELLSGYIATTHVHDNHGKTDEHLVPFDGTVNWSATLMALSKVGYAGPYIFELPDHGNAELTLARAVAARGRMETIQDDLARPFTFSEDP